MQDTTPRKFDTIGKPAISLARKLALLAKEQGLESTQGFASADAADALVWFALAEGGAIPADLERLGSDAKAVLRQYKAGVRTHWTQDDKRDAPLGTDRIGAGASVWAGWQEVGRYTAAPIGSYTRSLLQIAAE